MSAEGLLFFVIHCHCLSPFDIRLFQLDIHKLQLTTHHTQLWSLRDQLVVGGVTVNMSESVLLIKCDDEIYAFIQKM